VTGTKRRRQTSPTVPPLGDSATIGALASCWRNRLYQARGPAGGGGIVVVAIVVEESRVVLEGQAAAARGDELRGCAVENE
jgi:hypothetical protein